MRACSRRLTHLVSAVVVAQLTTFASATDYYVATNGSNSNSGTLNQPFLTIQQAANVVLPGDNVYVKVGTYREKVTLTKSGTASAPITFQPYQGAQVTITGLDVLSSSWSQYSGSTYSATASGASQVFVNGQMMNLARFPNAGYNNPLRANVATVDSASIQPFPANSTISSAALIGAGNFNGAKMAIPSGGKYVTIGAPVTQTGNSLNFQWPSNYSNPVYHPAPGNKFYLYGTLTALNSPKEWYYDAPGSRLYLQAPGGVDPASQTVEIRTRELGFDLGSQSYVQVSGFRLHAAGINIAGIHNVIDKVQVVHPTSFTDPAGWNTPNDPAGVRISGRYNTVQNSEIAYSWGDGIRVTNLGNTIQNNLIHDVNWGGTDAAFVNADGAGGGNTISNNTMYNAGRSGVTFRYANSDTKIEHNDISRFGYLTADLGGIYTFQGQNTGSVVAYNRVRDNLSTGTNAGIYMDVDSTGVTAHHNLVSNSGIGVLIYGNTQGPQRIYNNTLWGVNTATLAANGLTNINMVNNLSNNGAWVGANVSHNWTGSNPFVNSAAGDYTLRSGTGPVNYGVAIPGLTDGYNGSAPDAGAFESGNPAWTSGANFWTWLFSNQVAAPLASALHVAQSGQRVTTGPLMVGNVSSTSSNSRTFFKFDLSGVSQEIVSATLRIYENAVPIGNNGGVELLRVLSTWTPTDVSFNQSVDTSTLISGFYDPANLDLYTDIDVTSIVRAWLENPSTNFGFSLRGTEGLAGTAKFFDGLYGVTAPQLLITLTPVTTLSGDFDGDGDVDGADFVVWQTHFPLANGATLATGDADEDGDVDGADFVIWQTHFPTASGPGSSSVAEPATMCLLFTGLPGLCLLKWSRSQGVS